MVTATVTFAVGLIPEKMFERTVTEAAQEGAETAVNEKLSSAGVNAPGLKAIGGDVVSHRRLYGVWPEHCAVASDDEHRPGRFHQQSLA